MEGNVGVGCTRRTYGACAEAPDGFPDYRKYLNDADLLSDTVRDWIKTGVLNRYREKRDKTKVT